MIVPRFWAEGRVQHRDKDRQVTVRRFGWSNESLPDAQAMADARAAEALQNILGGKKLLRREPKVPYNGASGVPIREEIIGEFGDTVITRNVYGALCLNTPNVLFGDFDYVPSRESLASCLMFPSVFAISTCIGFATGSWMAGVAFAVIAIVLVFLVAAYLDRSLRVHKGRHQSKYLARVRRFVERHPSWSIRVYETPAGLRLLATHCLFSPTEVETSQFFKTLKIDPIYRRMCERQNCFRARVSPKPWRIGMEKHMRPRPGTWPIKPEQLSLRQAWVEDYQQRAKDFASCRFVETIGSGVVHPDVASVLQVHDELCQSQTDLPIA